MRREAAPSNIAVNLTVRPVTRLAGLSLSRDSHAHAQGACPSRPAGYRGRYAYYCANRLLNMGATMHHRGSKAILLALIPYCVLLTVGCVAPQPVLIDPSQLLDSTRQCKQITAPELVSQTAPRYSGNSAGKVTLEAVITTDGMIRDVRVVQSSDPALSKAATDAVVNWKYKPATCDGLPVAVHWTVVIDFTTQR